MQFVYRFEAMTTPCEIILFAKSKEQADKTAKKILHETKRLEKKYNYFSPTSYLSALNSRDEAFLDSETLWLLKKAIDFYHKTNGVFDITIGTIKDIYKNSTTLSEIEYQKNLLLPFVGCEHIQLKKRKLYFDNPHTKIDLGGFIKEYAVDKAIEIIKKNKISGALVNFGGDIYALGKKTDGSKFKIGIKDPKNNKKIAKFVEIENKALTTSASYERNITIQTKIFSHILSKNKDSSICISKSVSVISPTCLQSGVYSTALIIDPTLRDDDVLIV